MRVIAMALLLAALALGVAACGGDGGGGSSSNAGSGKTTLELDDNYFQPKTIQGDPGKKITLELKNQGKVKHNFTLAEQSVDQNVAAGATAKVTVTVPMSGTLTFYCKYHRSQGMEGTLKSSSSGY